MSTVNLDMPTTQERFGVLVGVSQPAVSELLASGVLAREATAHQWLLAYCANLREQAAGRATTGGLDLATERARLASEQADRVAMINAKARRETAPVALLEAVLAQVCRQIAGVLEALPTKLRRASDRISTEELALIEREIVEARNLAANITLNLEEVDGSIGDPEGDTVGPQAS